MGAILAQLGVPEAPPALLIFFGMLLLAAGIFGGGFQLAAINVPKISGWSRAVSDIIGAMLLVFGVALFLEQRMPESAQPPKTVEQAQQNAKEAQPSGKPEERALSGQRQRSSDNYRALVTSGDWEAYVTATSSGKAQCGMFNKADQHLIVYYERGDDHFSVLLSSPSWNLTDGAQYRAAMRFDRQSPWDVAATAKRFANTGKWYIDSDLSIEDAEPWMRQFIGADRLVVAFPSSSVPQWVLDLAGTEEVGPNFLRCALDLAGVRR